MGILVEDEKYGKYKSAFEILTGTPMKAAFLKNKIISQKTAYLLYKFGINVFYTDFSWYLYGVFSWDLWNSMIHNLDEEKSEIDPGTIENIEKFRENCKNAEIDEYFEDSRKMELITTVLYWAEKKGYALDENNDDLISIAIQKKEERNFSREEVKESISRLKKIAWGPSQN